MATNLRLSDEAARALRERAAHTGRPQQDLLREAVDVYLGLDHELTEMERAVREGRVEVPTPFVDIGPRLRLPAGTRTLDLLDRDER